MENPKANWLTWSVLSPLCVCLYLGIFGDVVISEDLVGILIVSFPSLWKKSSENNQTQLKTESDILNLITHSSDVTLCASLSAFLAVLLGPLIQQKPEPKTDKDLDTRNRKRKPWEKEKL